jgi:thiamine pyrophosphate-dependent acetolactate synthase large subunit-like protein
LLLCLRSRLHTCSDELIARALAVLRTAKRPLVVVGKGCAYARAEAEVTRFVEASGLPFLATPMGKGVVPDDHALCANAARSVALKKADVVVLLGARLNWILHFGLPPRFQAGALNRRVLPCFLAARGDLVPRRDDVLVPSGCGCAVLSKHLGCGRAKSVPVLAAVHWSGSYVLLAPADVKIIQVDISGEEIGVNVPAAVGLVGDAKAISSQLAEAVIASGFKYPATSPWWTELHEKVLCAVGTSP